MFVMDFVELMLLDPDSSIQIFVMNVYYNIIIIL